MPITSEKLRPKKAPKPSSQTTPRDRSNIRSTNISTHSATSIECCFSKLKQFRRVATRYEKTARNYLAIVTIAATMLWLR